MKISSLAYASLLALTIAAPAFAETPAAPAEATPPAQHEGHAGPMQTADTNNDGLLSKAEFMAVQEKRFADMDTNKDGNISRDEMRGFRDKMGEMRKEMMEKHKEGAPKPE